MCFFAGGAATFTKEAKSRYSFASRGIGTEIFPHVHAAEIGSDQKGGGRKGVSSFCAARNSSSLKPSCMLNVSVRMGITILNYPWDMVTLLFE
jgi:hypothetical protein